MAHEALHMAVIMKYHAIPPEMVKLIREWAAQHEKETGHGVWTHLRALEDLHVECFECTRLAKKSSTEVTREEWNRG